MVIVKVPLFYRRPTTRSRQGSRGRGAGTGVVRAVGWRGGAGPIESRVVGEYRGVQAFQRLAGIHAEFLGE